MYQRCKSKILHLEPGDGQNTFICDRKLGSGYRVFGHARMEMPPMQSRTTCPEFRRCHRCIRPSPKAGQEGLGKDMQAGVSVLHFVSRQERNVKKNCFHVSSTVVFTCVSDMRFLHPSCVGSSSCMVDMCPTLALQIGSCLE